MIGLRTIEGVNLEILQNKFGAEFLQYFLLQIKPALQNNNAIKTATHISLTQQGKFLADGIAADCFKV
jgi:oxygen-independent coproporphyrinogen III oxidase